MLTASFADRDLILFDQRGTRDSVPFLRCEEHDPVALAELTGQTTPADALTADAAAYAACAARFAGAGYDLAAFNTLESAADVRDVVTALGYADYDFHGTGYGTRIGQALLRDLPTGLRSVVLDSVEPAARNTLPLRAGTFHDALHVAGQCLLRGRGLLGRPPRPGADPVRHRESPDGRAGARAGGQR